MTKYSPLVRVDGTELSNRFELQLQGISVESGRSTQALITSVGVGNTGFWDFTESCTRRFTEATAMPTRTSEVERARRNIAEQTESNCNRLPGAIPARKVN